MNCWQEVIFWAVTLSAFTLAITLLYLLGMAVYQRVYQRRIDWRYLLQRGFNYALSIELFVVIAILVNVPLQYLQRVMDKPVLFGLLYGFWFTMYFVAILWKRPRHDPHYMMTAIHKSFTGILFIAGVHLVSLWVRGLPFYTVFIVLPLINLTNIVTNFNMPFFPWGKHPPQEDGVPALG